MSFQSYLRSMSNLSFVELELFYTEALAIFIEIRDKKLLKKLPDEISSRIGDLVVRYQKPENAEITALGYDTRQHAAIPAGAFTSSDLSDFWWKGNVEVKGLFKGQKAVKCYCIGNGARLSLFAGAKKKPLKGQMVLSPAAILKMVPDGRKQGNMFTISEMSYETVTLKFSSVDDGRAWYEAHHTSRQSVDVTSILSGNTDGSGILYEALDDMLEGGHVEDDVSKSDAVSCSTASEDQRTESCRDELEPDYSTSMEDNRSLKLRSERNSTENRPDSRTNSYSVISPHVIEEHVPVLNEVPPESWGSFKHEQVYQTEWNFNLNRAVLPDKGLLSLQRGQLVLLKEAINGDWWRALDCSGNEGFIASCFLSTAYEL